VVSRRAEKLEIECIQGISDKAKVLNELSQDLKVDLKNAMFVGNDMNDISAFKIVGFPVGVADSHESIIPHIIFTLEKSGGKGAVREICDIIFNAFSE
jgi:YrbI family 3-deoxy-D-manno-octulosonate 8-phosphate phosphatase